MDFPRGNQWKVQQHAEFPLHASGHNPHRGISIQDASISIA